MKLSEHFSEEEFHCHCGKCTFPGVKPELIDLLELIRDHFDTPVHVVSGYRCPAHNATVDGAKLSQHVVGKAADIRLKGVNPADVASYVEQVYPNTYGVGRYRTFTHVDVRKQKARWKG